MAARRRRSRAVSRAARSDARPAAARRGPRTRDGARGSPPARGGSRLRPLAAGVSRSAAGRTGQACARGRLRRGDRESSVGDAAGGSRAWHGIGRRWSLAGALRATIGSLPRAGPRPRQPVSAVRGAGSLAGAAGGRIGLVVPAGFLSDDGPAPLRRALIATADLDAVTVFDNRRGLFPIHRSVRFAALTATRGGPTRAIRCRFRVDDPAAVESVPPVVLTPAALQRLSGPGLEIPELPTPDDLRIVEALTVRHPALASPEGWGAVFARELNATDDRDCFTPAGSLAVVEGKHILPFRVDPAGVRLRADADRVARRLSARSRVGEPRLAYRDVAAASNRLTLIAAIVPAGAVTVHTAFCLRTGMPMRDQRVLMALLNRHGANHLVRC